MVTMAKGGLSIVLFNLLKILNHRITVLSVTALLVVLVSWQAGSLVWKFWLLKDEAPQAATGIPMQARGAEPDSLRDLLRYPLIRSDSQPTAATGSAATDAPETSLNLKLVGLMYSADQKEARAIISSEKDGVLSYSTHERVAGKAEIDSIEPDRVILLHAGKREALLLDPDDRAAVIQADTGGQTPGEGGRSQASSASPSAAPRVSDTTPPKIDDLMRDYLLTPVMERGQLVGFHLEAVKNPAIMSEWGIAPDDVITAVNGVPLNSQGRIMILYDKLKKQREFELTVDNGGKSRTILIDLNE